MAESSQVFALENNPPVYTCLIKAHTIGMHDYQDRYEAGKILAETLRQYSRAKDLIVLALPRGGVPVAYEVARSLSAPLDVFIVRKLGVPGHEELALGAISAGVTVFNDEIVQSQQISEDEIEAVIAHETAELERREAAYRGNRRPLNLKDKTVILVDDGIATGATIKAAIQAIKHQKPAKLIAAVPVADVQIQKEIAAMVDEFACPLVVDGLNAVGAWFVDFSQTEDQEVHDLLTRSRHGV